MIRVASKRQEIKMTQSLLMLSGRAQASFIPATGHRAIIIYFVFQITQKSQLHPSSISFYDYFPLESLC